MDQHQYQLMQVIERMEVFKGLTEKEVRSILGISKMRTYPLGHRIYTYDEPSDAMVILLKGQTIVTTESGTGVGSLVQGMSVGEMGFFTGHPRSANVTTTVESSVLEIHKDEFYPLLEESWRMHVKVLQNVVDLLSQRVIETGHRVEDYAAKVQMLEEAADASGESKDEEPKEAE